MWEEWAKTQHSKSKALTDIYKYLKEINTHTLPSGKPKVDDLDLMTRPIHTKDVLRLKVKQLVRHAD